MGGAALAMRMVSSTVALQASTGSASSAAPGTQSTTRFEAVALPAASTTRSVRGFAPSSSSTSPSENRPSAPQTADRPWASRWTVAPASALPTRVTCARPVRRSPTAPVSEEGASPICGAPGAVPSTVTRRGAEAALSSPPRPRATAVKACSPSGSAMREWSRLHRPAASAVVAPIRSPPRKTMIRAPAGPVPSTARVRSAVRPSAIDCCYIFENAGYTL